MTRAKAAAAVDERRRQRLLRLPFADVERYLRAHVLEHLDPEHPNNLDALLARRIGCPREYIARWRCHGLTVDQADRIATLLGLHPSFLFLDWETLVADGIGPVEYKRRPETCHSSPSYSDLEDTA